MKLLMQSWIDRIALGRDALARGNGHSGIHPDSPVATLLALLWHEEREVRQAAVRSLPGGDRFNFYAAHYGYFAEAFLRELTARCAARPDHAADCYQVAIEALTDMIAQCARDLRALSNMHYSFLSSALYLAVVATCRDALQAAMRLRSAAVHEAICSLLWNLTTIAGGGRMNPADMLILIEAAGCALATLPPDEIPAFWAALSHTNPTRRAAVSPALRQLSDPRAAGYLLAALPLQKPEVAEPILVCLGRLGNPLALPLLQEYSRSRHRTLNRAAKAAIEAIRIAQREHPDRTLLRPSTLDLQELVRPATGMPASETDPLPRPRPIPTRRGEG